MNWQLSQFLRFCVVGTAGFLVDAGITLLLTQIFSVGATSARVLAFLIAVSVTWALNRHFTFQVDASVSTWLPYLMSSSLGALINVAIYLLWLRWAGHSGTQILAAVAIGSIGALAFNFTISRYVIFRANRLPHA